MKLINEKGKLFGLINLVDLLVILFILLVVGGVAWKVFGAQIMGVIDDISIAGKQRETVTYTVRITGVDPIYYDQAMKIGLPQQLAINEGVVDGCYLIGMTSEQAYTVTTDATGTTNRVPYEGRIDIICTVEAKIPPGDFITVGSQEVRIGKSHVVKTQFFELTGLVQTIDANVTAFAPGMSTDG